MIVIEREAPQLEYVYVSNPTATKKVNPSDYYYYTTTPVQQQQEQYYDDSYDNNGYYSLASTSFSSSTTSALYHYYSSSDDEEERKRVTFSNKNEVHYVQPINNSDHDLFYSYHDEQRFREEYNLEKRLLAQLEMLTMEYYEGDLQDLLYAVELNRRRICHIAIVHNNKIHTYCHPKQRDEYDDNNNSTVDNFFDCDSFWTGSMTWHL